MRTILLLFCTVSALAAQEDFFRPSEMLAVPTLGEDLTGMLGASFGDYDNDGWPDMLATPHFNRRMWLVRNDSGRRFTSRTALLPRDAEQRMKAYGNCWADYDNDGDQDLFAPLAESFASEDMLLRNDRGVFRAVSRQAGLDLDVGTLSATWLDVDRDGHLDLMVAYILKNESTLEDESRLAHYRNLGDGTFVDLTVESGLNMLLYPEGRRTVIAAADYNDDGWVDLLVGVPLVAKRLFLNDGDGTFTEDQAGFPPDDSDISEISVGDVDGDGDMDVLTVASATVQEGEQGVIFQSKLLLNLGGEFLDVTAGAGLSTLAETPFASRLADIDNDGDLDIVISGRPARLFLNDGQGLFIDASDRSGIPGRRGDALALADVNDDGVLDLATQGVLHYGRKNTNHFLRVLLVGTESNRDGIGTLAIARTGNREQTRYLSNSTSFHQDEMVLHFGLGDSEQVDELELRWPSGQVDVLRDIPADQVIRVIEGSNDYDRAARTTFTHDLPDSVESGSSHTVHLAVRPALFGAGAVIESVAADLSRFGGSQAVPLIDRGDGSYDLQASLVFDLDPAIHELSVSIVQNTRLGEYWTQVSAVTAVMPRKDLVLFDEGGEGGWRLVAGEHGRVEPRSTDRAHRGSTSQAITLRPPGSTLSDTVTYQLDEPQKADRGLWQQRRGYDRWTAQNPPPQPGSEPFIQPEDRAGVELTGYTHLSFWLHPGDSRIDSLFLDIGGTHGAPPAFFHLPSEVSIGPPDPSARLATDSLRSPDPQISFGYGLRLFQCVLFINCDRSEGTTEQYDSAHGLPKQSYIVNSGLGRSFLDLDLTGNDWVAVHAPLDSLRGGDTDLRLPFIRIRGGVEGTFYIDELRLTRNPEITPTAVVESRDDAATPDAFTLAQNFPNPFNPETTIRFDLPQSSEAELSLHNLTGQRVATLMRGFREAGSYRLTWDGRDEAGRALASGVYFYRLRAGDHVETRKLTLLR